MKTWRISLVSVVAFFVAASALVFVLVAWFFADRVLQPPITCPSDFHVFCTTPAERGIAYEEVHLRTVDGVDLPAWYMPAAGAHKAVIFVHGHGVTRNEGLRFAKALHEAGFTLLAIDLRRNHGRYASMGYHERKDVTAGIDFLMKEKHIDSLGLMGFSMGAATSIWVMDEDPRVKAGLFSSPYASMRDVLAEAAKRHYGLPYYPLFPVVEAMIDWRADMRTSDVVPEDHIGNIAPRPVLIFHCRKDLTTDPSHSQRLFDKARSPKEFWLAPCEEHERVWNVSPEEAERRSVAFFKANL